MASELLIGKGWAFPPRINPQGGIARSEGPGRVQDAIWMILATSPGERIMRPQFGAGVKDVMFSPNSELNRAALEDAIQQALVRWEPRIELERVSVEEGSSRSEVLVKIDYRLRDTNELFNLVYPLYIEEGAG
ncbi:MAG: GPW/gp25 family protein [Acidobacteriota bacterium]|jgi:phage baseplate assembly protein W